MRATRDHREDRNSRDVRACHDFAMGRPKPRRARRRRITHARFGSAGDRSRGFRLDYLCFFSLRLHCMEMDPQPASTRSWHTHTHTLTACRRRCGISGWVLYAARWIWNYGCWVVHERLNSVTSGSDDARIGQVSGHTEIGVVILQQVNFLFLITHKFIVNKVQGELLQQLTHETSTEIGRPFFFKAEGVLGGVLFFCT